MESSPSTNLVLDPDTLDNPEENLTEPLTTVGIGNASETDQRILELPLCRGCLLDPVGCHSEVPIDVAHLPSITR